MKLLKRLRAGKAASEADKAADGSDADAVNSEAESRFIEQGSRNDTRRELIRVVLRDTVRRSGIPPDWLRGEILTVASRNAATIMHVRLVMLHWDERLLRHSLAFEHALRHEIEQFEPQASQWLQSISWQIDAQAGCPHTELPDPKVWTEAPVQVDPESELREDLERLFAVRDLERARFLSTQPGAEVTDFDRTEPDQLR